MSPLAFEEQKILQFTFLTFHFFSLIIVNILREKKNIMQLCSQSYSQVDYWELTEALLNK